MLDSMVICCGIKSSFYYDTELTVKKNFTLEAKARAPMGVTVISEYIFEQTTKGTLIS